MYFIYLFFGSKTHTLRSTMKPPTTKADAIYKNTNPHHQETHNQ